MDWRGRLPAQGRHQRTSCAPAEGPTPTGTGTFKAHAYTTVDLRATVKLPDVGLAKGVQLALEVNNLFDQDPPFFPATDGIGGAYNPIGRYVAVSLRKAF